MFWYEIFQFTLLFKEPNYKRYTYINTFNNIYIILSKVVGNLVFILRGLLFNLISQGRLIHNFVHCSYNYIFGWRLWKNESHFFISSWIQYTLLTPKILKFRGNEGVLLCNIFFSLSSTNGQFFGLLMISSLIRAL